MAAENLNLAGTDQVVELLINGEALTITEGYEVKISVLTQPAAFTLRLGWGDTAKALLDKCKVGSMFQLKIGGVLQQSGIIDSRGVPSSDATVVEVKGRDYMRRLFNSHVEEEISLKERTYYDLTRKVMDLCGLQDHKLIAGNGANRQAVTGTAVPIEPTEEQLVRSRETGLPTPGGTRMEFVALKAKIGQRWYDWLQEKYKLVGLFLWCAGDGTFILATPQPNVAPSTTLVRQRGATRNAVNIQSHSFRDDATNRHAKYIVYGRIGHGKGGRNKIRGEFIDDEMVAAGLLDVITYHDDDISNQTEAEYLARKYASEEHRAGWELRYTVGGHRTLSTIDGNVAVWGPDTASQVDDQELGIVGPHYIESVTFRGFPRTASVELIRPEDLLYLAEKSPEQKRASANGYAKAKAKPSPVAEEAATKETDWTQWTWKNDPPPAAPVATTDPSNIFYRS
jgi:prophage tail gpP-like protein